MSVPIVDGHISQSASNPNLISWLRSYGGYVHPSLSFLSGPSYGGSTLIATSPISQGETLVSCPPELVISAELARDALVRLIGGNETTREELKNLKERQVIAGYVVAHWVFGEHQSPSKSKSIQSDLLKHHTYVRSLPPASDLTTPLHWSSTELELIHGSNIYHAAFDRRKEWQFERDSLLAVLRSGEDRDCVEQLVNGITWDRYLLANTYITSRAFPSTLVTTGQLPSSSSSSSPSQIDINDNNAYPDKGEETSYPVLLPGLDTLNHRREAKVAWSRHNDGAVGIATDVDIGEGQEVFNNYGPKTNESLLLGYGFLLSSNPDETVVLKLGHSIASSLPPTVLNAIANDAHSPPLRIDESHQLRRDGAIPERLEETVRILVSRGEPSDSEEQDEEATLELEMDVLQTLTDMVESKMAKMGEIAAALEEVTEDGRKDQGIRQDVYEMSEEYIRGQLSILQTAYDRLLDRIDQLEDGA